MKTDIHKKHSSQEEEKSPLYKNNALMFVIFALILNLLGILYINLSKTAYYWSTAESWNIAIKIARGDFYPNLWGEVYNSILTLDVNYLSALPSALFIKLFGQTRIVYILSLINLYLVPSYILIYNLVKKAGKAPWVTLVMTLFAFPSAIYMAFMGFAEIGGFVFGMACMNIYFSKESKRHTFIRYFAIGLLLTLAVLWSNIYLFFSVAFITAMLACAIIFKKKLSGPLVSLCTFAAIIALFFRSYFLNRIIALYGKSSFDLNIALNLKFIFRYIGLIFVLMLIGYSIWMAVKKKNHAPVFLWIELVVSFLMLTSTCMHGQLHIIIYLPALIALYIHCIRYISTEKILLGMAALSLLQSVSVFLPRTQPSSVSEIKSFSALPSFSMQPRTRNSVYDILSLKTELDNIVGPEEYLGVLAHSDIMNADLLNNVELSLNKKQLKRNYIAFTIPCFDTENLDISPLCNANYMLVAIPAQTIAENQVILSTAVDSFANWTDIAKAYVEMYEYETVIDNTVFKLFKRIRPVTDFEKRTFQTKYQNNLTVN